MKFENIADGVLIVDKPQGWTSHDVCAFVRKRFRLSKVGHAGTLDPIATGVLVLLLGRATKKSMEFSASDKHYDGTMKLGIKTDSHDLSGKTLAEAPWQHVTLEDIRQKTRDLYTGEIQQVPPMVSALKHQGVRLYQLARKGKEVPRESRRVIVHRFDILEKRDEFVTFSSAVSKGTYVRTLVNDLGESLGCLATLAELKRVRSGFFRIEQAVTVEALKNMTLKELREKILPLGALPAHASPV
jgi:tRNA pseudouridine55 synthase